MKRITFFIIFTLVLCINCKVTYSYIEPSEMESNEQYQKLEDLKKELKEERKKIDQQRLEEIRLKEEEKRKKESGNSTKDTPQNNTLDGLKEGELNKKNDTIPKLIVRLRGKHSTKYLCSYKFTMDSQNVESVLENSIITDYKSLLKKPSLKVRANEVINFEFDNKPKQINVFIWNEEVQDLQTKRGSIRVPDMDGIIVIGIDGKYKNGSVRYAIVLDIRK